MQQGRKGPAGFTSTWVNVHIRSLLFDLFFPFDVMAAMTMACAANNIYDYLNYFENDTKEMKERKNSKP